ncbi:hypothetical protein T01_14613 [Trichinella spiralis]|uniref:Uncharacterized protein n=1 Tax=Trichinella spiralis TaxID=6334 RepID=A0A0V0YU64_TRISP|nr:hypothetical protein T01_14613 [Trichinella spiralis]
MILNQNCPHFITNGLQQLLNARNELRERSTMLLIAT